MKVVKAVAKAFCASVLFFVVMNALPLIVYPLLGIGLTDLHIHWLVKFMLVATPTVFIFVLGASMKSKPDKETA